MASVVGDIGLRFQEGVQDLKIGQQLAPTRDAISKTLVTGSTNFFKVIGGVRGRLIARTPTPVGLATPPESGRGTPVDLGKDSDTASIGSTASTKNPPAVEQTPPPPQQTTSPQIVTSEFAQRATSTFSGWGSGIGSLFSNKGSRFSLGGGSATTPASIPATATSPAVDKPKKLEDIPENFVPRDLDAEREQAKKEQAEREQAEREHAEREQVERERAEKEQAKREQTEKEQAEKGQAEKERAEKEKLAAGQPQA